jgi:hypothetical protein
MATLIVAAILTIVSVKEELGGLAIDTREIGMEASQGTTTTSTTVAAPSLQSSEVDTTTTTTKEYKKLELKGILYHTFSRLVRFSNCLISVFPFLTLFSAD